MPLVIMPFLDNWPMTQQAAEDVLGMGNTPDLLLVNNGSSRETAVAQQEWLTRRRVTDYAQSRRVRLWGYPLPIPLAAVWNTALNYAWTRGETEALVVNNDVRLRPDTYEILRAVKDELGALFVSGVGVTEEQYVAAQSLTFRDLLQTPSKGGPDFSCFLISQVCHEHFPFDEEFRPAYCEDLDYHRRLMLAGERDRIFSVNLPFHHIDRGSGTLKAMDEEKRQRFARRIDASRAYYQQKWGGPPNQETFTIPFGPDAVVGVTTPELQHGTH